MAIEKYSPLILTVSALTTPAAMAARKLPKSSAIQNGQPQRVVAIAPEYALIPKYAC